MTCTIHDAVPQAEAWGLGFRVWGLGFRVTYLEGQGDSVRFGLQMELSPV